MINLKNPSDDKKLLLAALFIIMMINTIAIGMSCYHNGYVEGVKKCQLN